MADVAIIAVMFVSAMIPFAVMARLMLAQKSGLALTVMSLLAAAVAIFIFASTTPVGIDPLFAIGVAMVSLLPALIGAGAGALLGHLLLRRRFKD
ncbi:MAG: UDP-N-acetylmuramate--alanine ligase [Yoonia sp.]|nr:UDP-N-acetylmuramate--alanine ligase [Yoonia sp.]